MQLYQKQTHQRSFPVTFVKFLRTRRISANGCFQKKANLANAFKPVKVEVIVEKPPTKFLMSFIARCISQTFQISIDNDIDNIYFLANISTLSFG